MFFMESKQPRQLVALFLDVESGAGRSSNALFSGGGGLPLVEQEETRCYAYSPFGRAIDTTDGIDC